MLYVDWLLSLFLFVFAPIVNFVVAFFTRLISASTKRAQERIADLSSNLTEVLAGERIVKAFGRESYENNRFAASNDAYFGAYMKVLQLGQTQTPIVAMIVTIALLAIMAFSVREVIVGRLTSGQVLQFWTLVVFAINPLNRFASFIGDISRGLIGASRVFEVLDVPIESISDADTIEPLRIDGALRFENVSFAYKDDGPKVLSDLSATIAAGEIVALVGPSGAGKTTIVNLVPRFYEPQSGTITLDGTDLRRLHLGSLRNAIAIVPQEAMLFSGTVAENIRYGRLDATQAEVEAAAREANAEEFILDLPLGYETPVGDRGMRLSGGQRQRISIARAVLRDPRILILDEATSALDSHSERLIEAALDRLLPGRTTLIIAHRLSTIRRANKILYVDAGRILESGTHEALLAQGNHYAKLHAAQFA
jgi:subfamily B ATP-binding cassette protein MsbA